MFGYPSMNAPSSLSLLLPLAGLSLASTAALAATPTRLTLAPGAATEHRLSAGESHIYGVTLAAGRTWLIEVEQEGIDIILAAKGPGCDPCAVDAPTYRRGPETLLLEPEIDGSWSLEIRTSSNGSGPGAYRITLVELRTDTAAARTRRSASSLVSQASWLVPEGTEEARRNALELYADSLQHWQALGDARRSAWTQLAAAILHAGMNEPEPALDLFRGALALFQELGSCHGEAIALNEMGLLASDRLTPGTRRAYLEQALGVQQDLGNLFGQAMALNNLCLVDHNRGLLRKAETCYREALELLRMAEEEGQRAPLLSNLANVYESLGERDLAIGVFRQSLEIQRATGDLHGEAKTLTDLGVYFRRLGEHQEAIAQHQAALEIFRQLGDRRQEARALSNLASAYNWLGEPGRALPFLEEALPLRRAVADHRGEAATLNILGRAYASLGDTGRAAEHHRRALGASRKANHRQSEATSLSLLGSSELAGDDPAVALAYFADAAELLAESGDRRMRANVMHQTGKAHLRLSDPERALQSFAQALQLRRAIDDQQGEAQTRGAMAAAEVELGRLSSARRQVEAALKLIESLRTRIVDPDLRATFSSSQRQAYELHIDLLMRLHARQPDGALDRAALEANERARARTLVDLLHQIDSRVPETVPTELRQRWGSLQRRLDDKAFQRVKLLSSGKDDTEVKRELFKVLGDLETIEAQIRKQSPAYAALTRPRPLSTADIQGLLDPDTMLLEYSLGEERSFLWALTTETLESFELPARQEIEEACQEAYAALSIRDPRARASDAQALNRLSDLVLGPIASRLADHRLVIVADGALHYIPFGALPSPPGAGAVPRRRPDPWLRDHEIVHLPSASALAAQRLALKNRPVAQRQLAVLADPVFDRLDSRIQKPGSTPSPPRLAAKGEMPRSKTPRPGEVLRGATSSDRSGLQLHRLVATRKEAAAIADLLPAQEVFVATDFDATRELAFSGKLRDFRIVHFATHGWIDSENPELSSLVLSLVDRRGTRRDGFLRLRDLYNLQLAGDLVVLSGCSTALGREIRGEGLVGLTRGFMYAGVPKVVASLWQVEDRVTADLMARFYRAMLVDKLSEAAALRRAQLSIASERGWRDPFYWAAFVLQGDWS